MSFTRIWKEPKARLSWKHAVAFGYWCVTVIPACILIVLTAVCEFLGAGMDHFYGRVHMWANYDAYAHPTHLRQPEAKLPPMWPDAEYSRDYMNADKESITQPYPPIEVIDKAIVGIEQSNGKART